MGGAPGCIFIKNFLLRSFYQGLPTENLIFLAFSKKNVAPMNGGGHRNVFSLKFFSFDRFIRVFQKMQRPRMGGGHRNVLSLKIFSSDHLISVFLLKIDIFGIFKIVTPTNAGHRQVFSLNFSVQSFYQGFPTENSIFWAPERVFIKNVFLQSFYQSFKKCSTHEWKETPERVIIENFLL